MNYLFKNLDTKIKTVVSYNNQSLQTEHRIKSLIKYSELKHLTNSMSDVAKILTISYICL